MTPLSRFLRPIKALGACPEALAWAAWLINQLALRNAATADADRAYEAALADAYRAYASALTSTVPWTVVEAALDREDTP